MKSSRVRQLKLVLVKLLKTQTASGLGQESKVENLPRRLNCGIERLTLLRTPVTEIILNLKFSFEIFQPLSVRCLEFY